MKLSRQYWFPSLNAARASSAAWTMRSTSFRRGRSHRSRDAKVFACSRKSLVFTCPSTSPRGRRRPPMGKPPAVSVRRPRVPFCPRRPRVDDVLDRDDPLWRVSAGRVERTYKQSVQQLRQKRESVLMARALLELGSFFFTRASETDATRQQWRAGVDCLFATLDAITTRRKIMYGQLVPAYSSHAPNVSTQKLPSYPVFSRPQ